MAAGIGNRVTYMQPVVLDGLKVVLKDLNIGAKDPQDSGDGRGLWFTFAQEAGHYWGQRRDRGTFPAESRR